MRITVIEDDDRVARGLVTVLVQAGFEVRRIATAAEAACAVPSDVVLVDLGLPDGDGLDVIRKLRNHPETAVIAVTARSEEHERVRGLRAGADDYLIKPFSFPELLARLSAVSRRSLNLTSQHLHVGPLSLDLSTRRVSRDNVEIDLTPTEFSLLEFLMRNAGQVLTRKMLSEHLWDSDWEGVTNVIEVHITRLRGKIDRDFDLPLLQTIRGRGYVLRGV
jgi:DNA-binding response OmpR family regulator